MLVLVDVVERLDKGKFFQEAKRGAHIYNEKCIYLRGRRITIWLHQSTRVIVDGEYLTAQKKITIAVETDKINIVC
jgi:diacylglycerol kinase family enzyme